MACFVDQYRSLHHPASLDKTQSDWIIAENKLCDQQKFINLTHLFIMTITMNTTFINF